MYRLSPDQAKLNAHVESLAERINDAMAGEEGIEDAMQRGLEVLVAQKYMGLTVPDAFGGTELDTVSAMIIVTGIARASAAVAHVLNANVFGFCNPVSIFGTPEQKETFLKKAAHGSGLGTLAFTEPSGCSLDAMNVKAQKAGGYYVLNGTKAMITFARRAEYALVFAKTGDMPSLRECFSFLVVELRKTGGISFGRTEKTMGMDGCQIAEIHFSDCRVPENCLLGKEGDGVTIVLKMLEVSRIANAAVSLGIAVAAFEEAKTYCKNRMLNGKPLIAHPHFTFQLAEMLADIKTMELLTYQAARLIDERDPGALLNASIAKYLVTERAKQICDKALQFHGGYGYIKGYKIERLYRDVRIHTIIGGSTELLLSYIGSTLTAS